jgi:ribonucleoside-diphosphate reductase beta chain
MNIQFPSSENRWVLFPIKHSDLWKLYKKAEASFWTSEEIELSKDIKDWNHLNPEEQHFLKYILAFFAASDGVVSENLALRFYKELDLPEARCFYGFQIAIENIHSETYSLLIDTYIQNPKEKEQLFNAIQTIPCIAQKAKWAFQWIENVEASFSQRLLAFAIVEGLFFSGSFCAIFWLKQRGILPGLTFSNELISRDETLHTDFAVHVYKHYMVEKLNSSVVHTMMSEAVDIEIRFITEALPCSLIGMNCNLMIQYVKFVADRLLFQLGYPKLYQTSNPFMFMEMIAMEGKTNFFEKKVSEYSKANIGGESSSSSSTITEINDEF